MALKVAVQMDPIQSINCSNESPRLIDSAGKAGSGSTA